MLSVAIGAISPNSPARADEHAASGNARHTNRLIDSNDPYLLLHAHNPVDWYPWGPEALEKAQREQKPIFLSVGYSTCYWCHVAEETIYSRQEFADLMNTWFVNIKVDREQRPDIDRLYMAATQAMTGRGGWPNNVFLTPDLKPFFAGSYFPPHDDEFGRPGFDSIIRSIHASWVEDPNRVRATAEKMFEALRDRQATPAGRGELIDPATLSERALAIWGERADDVHGGFGAANGARFPQQPVLALLMADPDRKDLALLTRALDAMAAGGLYDHIGGGFHRYAVEPSWSIPHFEKMLSDNAQLLEIYAKAFSLTRAPRYRSVATEVADYLIAQMMSPKGGFYTAQDAAVDGHEGQSYVWTRPEIVAVLGEEAAARFFKTYALTPMPAHPAQSAEQLLTGEYPGVLRWRMDGPLTQPQATEVSTWRRQLLHSRNSRRQPARDEKLVVSLNGLAIHAFARAGQWLGMPRYIEVARHSAEHVLGAAYDAKTGLRHEIFRGKAQTEAFLDDYALLGLGFLALHDATGDDTWQQPARQLADDMLARFRRADGSLATTTAEKDLPLPPPENGDNTSPSGSSAAVDLLLRLNRLTATTRYTDAAQDIVQHLSHRVEDGPDSWPSMLRALDENHFVPARAGFRSALSTQAVVHVSAAVTTKTGLDEIAVTLHIEDGYHVNANPATYDYLIATSMTFDGLTPDRVLYPAASLFKPAFAPAGLKVYEGKVTLIAIFPKGAIGNDSQMRVTVSTQACNSEICLPPAQLIVGVTRDGSL